MQMRPQAVTRMSLSWNGYSTSGSPCVGPPPRCPPFCSAADTDIPTLHHQASVFQRQPPEQGLSHGQGAQKFSFQRFADRTSHRKVSFADVSVLGLIGPRPVGRWKSRVAEMPTKSSLMPVKPSPATREYRRREKTPETRNSPLRQTGLANRGNEERRRGRSAE